jgi:hypothetical protein
LGVNQDVARKKAVHKSETVTRKSTATKNDGAIAQAEEAEIEGVTAETRKKKRPVRCIRRHTDVEFRREFPEVFDALVKKAKEGGTAETRLLLQIGKFGDPKAARRRGGKSLSELLLEELKRRQDEREAAADRAKSETEIPQTNEASSEGATRGGNAENE